MRGEPLNPGHRAQSLDRLAHETFDVVVVGGGITGAGAALDAATRGLSVALVEARDLAAGTSSRSGKLIHGGLRYLEMLDFALVREGLHERGLLMTRLAPHLVKPVPFLFPLRHRVWERLYVGAGLLLYDALGGRQTVPRARHLSRRGALQKAPGLRRDALIGAVQFYDAKEDDARYVVYVARTAADYGAAVATYASVTGLRHEGGRVNGVRVVDHETGSTFDVSARHVVTAAGVWTDDIRHMVPGGSDQKATIRPSKGIHILVPRDRIKADTGLFVRTEKSILFVVPWGRHWLLGDTDTDWPYDRFEPAASSADIDYLLTKANEVLRDPLTREDVQGVFAGLRPLASADEDVKTEKLSREHSVTSPVPGLSMITGGKYTTYRVMGKDLIDVAAQHLQSKVAASCTERVPITGAVGYEPRWNQRAQLADRYGIPVEQIERLLDRYGSCIDDLLARISDEPGLAQPLDDAGDYLLVEVAYACTHEGAMHLEDVLARRTRVAIETADRGMAVADKVARVMAAELGHDERWIEHELDYYAARVEAEAAAEASPDDRSANTARLRGSGMYPFYGPYDARPELQPDTVGGKFTPGADG